MNKENRLLIAKNHAESLGGTCLSDTYLGVDYKILWKCSNPEHPSWQATYYSVVVNKSWCLKCAYKIKGDKKRNNNGLKEAQEYAKKRNGLCLSTEYKNARTKLEWKCNNPKHKSWEASYDSTVNGQTWCNECSNFYYKEHQVRKILEYLLNTIFKKRRDLTWNINPKTGKKLELDGFSEDLKIAFEFQGKQHYELGCFNNSDLELLELMNRDKIKKENCLKNNITLLIFNDCKSLNSPKSLLNYVLNILNNQNIKYIKYDYKYIEKIYHDSNNFQLEQFNKANEHAKSLGGICLSKSYNNSKEKLTWKCNNPRHTSWKATYNNVVNNKTWCPECSGKLKPNDFLEKARIHAYNKGGYCLSDNFINVKTLMLWKCGNSNHDAWECSYYNIISRKTWCPYCANKFSKEYTLQQSIEYAKSMNGQSLSKEYKNNSTKMLWKCANPTHLCWESSYNQVVNKKSWCLQCNKDKQNKK